MKYNLAVKPSGSQVLYCYSIKLQGIADLGVAKEIKMNIKMQKPDLKISGFFMPIATI